MRPLTMVRSRLALFAAFVCLTLAIHRGPAPAAEPLPMVAGHETLGVNGWTVHVSETLRSADPAAMEQALRLLEQQLREVARTLPPGPLAKLRQVRIWMSPQPAGFRPTGEYHPDANWLRENGRDVAMARSIQFTNISRFAAEIRRMPAMVLHELAHAYHDRQLGFDEPRIRAAFDDAVKAGRYEQVRESSSGDRRRAYALTNHKEYFAELTEAYFGVNDFFPFHRAHLREHDPAMARLLGELWEVTPSKMPANPAPVNAPPATDARVASAAYVVGEPPADLKLPPFYRKHVSAGGYPIVSSAKVNDYALKEAAYLVDLMLARRPDVRRAMIDSGSRLIVIGRDEFSTDIPEYAHMTPKDFWDARARGFGGSQSDPVCSCGEENLLGFPGDPYATESIFIHEFAHNMHLRGLVRVDPEFDTRVKAAYDAAMKAKLWAGKYAAVNHHEYFAEGVQSWFNDNRAHDHDHNHVDTRAELRAYDPGLAALCESVFGDTPLSYTKPLSRIAGHLAGYEPADCPEFIWPERLVAVRAEIRAKAQARSDAAAGPNPGPPTKAAKPNSP